MTGTGELASEDAARDSVKRNTIPLVLKTFEPEMYSDASCSLLSGRLPIRHGHLYASINGKSSAIRICLNGLVEKKNGSVTHSFFVRVN